MPLKVDGVSDTPSSAEIVLATDHRQNRASVQFAKKVKLPEDSVTFTVTKPGKPDAEFQIGPWDLNRDNPDQHRDNKEDKVEWTMGSEWTLVTPPMLAEMFTDEDHMMAEAARLTAANPVMEGWNALLSVESDLTGSVSGIGTLLDLIRSGRLLMRIILGDFETDSDDVNKIVQILAYYHLVLDPESAGQLQFLLSPPEDGSDLEKLASWRSETVASDPSKVLIECRYLDALTQTTVLVTDGSELPAFRVLKPARTAGEARLEIELQREHK